MSVLCRFYMDHISLVALLTPLFSLLMIFRAFSLYSKKKQTWRELLAWVVVWGGIGYVAWNPTILDRLPPMVGIKSGVNVLIFFGFVVLFYAVFRLLVKVEELERKLVEVVRKQALEKKKK